MNIINVSGSLQSLNSFCKSYYVGDLSNGNDSFQCGGLWRDLSVHLSDREDCRHKVLLRLSYCDSDASELGCSLHY